MSTRRNNSILQSNKFKRGVRKNSRKGSCTQTIPSVTSVSKRRKRILSSTESASTEREHFDTDMELELQAASSMQADREEEFIADFMDKVDCNWDLILQRLRESTLWKNIEDDMNRMDTDMESLKRENEALRRRLQHTEGRLTRTEKKLHEANEQIIDLTTRSMRDNLVFKNVEETRGENLVEKLRYIFKEKLKIPEDELKEIQIDRVHRTGKIQQGRSRIIVAKFSGRGKSKIMAHLKNIPRDDKIKISEQFPPEVNARRNKLWPQFIEAKKSGKESKLNTDKLIVDKRVISHPTDKVRDINLNVTQRALELKPKHTAVTSVDKSHLQGHIISIKCVDDVIPAIHSLCEDQRVAGSSHLIYAYRVGNEKRYISNYEDDGQWGAGRELMRVLDQTGSFNHLLAVTQWNAGRHLDPSRFAQIRDMAEQAVKLAHS